VRLIRKFGIKINNYFLKNNNATKVKILALVSSYKVTINAVKFFLLKNL